LIRKLWEEAVVDHEDSDHRIDRAGIYRARNGRSRSGWEVSARPRLTGRLGSGTDFCSRAEAKPRRFKSRRGSKPSLSSSEGMTMPSASSPSSSTVAGTTNGLAILRRRPMPEGATYLS
jgi:hypothetical protein